MFCLWYHSNDISRDDEDDTAGTKPLLGSKEFRPAQSRASAAYIALGNVYYVHV